MRIPTLLAMVICDAVHEDPSNFKKTILGTFINTYAPEFPAEVPRICVYLAFTDLNRAVSFRLQVVDSRDDPVSVQRFDVESSDPLMLIEVAPVIFNIPVQSPGPLWVQLFLGDEPLQECRINVSSYSEEQ